MKDMFEIKKTPALVIKETSETKEYLKPGQSRAADFMLTGSALLEKEAYSLSSSQEFFHIDGKTGPGT